MPQVNVTEYLLLVFTPFCQVTIGTLLLVVPGWCLANRLKFDPLTKLLVATVASCTLMYLLALGAYLASLPQWIAFAVVMTVAIGSVVDPRANGLEHTGIAVECRHCAWRLVLCHQPTRRASRRARRLVNRGRCSG
jgi:hypothetical protein